MILDICTLHHLHTIYLIISMLIEMYNKWARSNVLLYARFQMWTWDVPPNTSIVMPPSHFQIYAHQHHIPKQWNPLHMIEKPHQHTNPCKIIEPHKKHVHHKLNIEVCHKPLWNPSSFLVTNCVKFSGFVYMVHVK